MAIIGKFSEVRDEETKALSYHGGISFAGVDVPLRIVKNEKPKHDRSPPFVVMDQQAGKYADGSAGVGFSNVTQDGKHYMGLKIDCTKFPGDLDCAMFPGDEAGQHIIVWNRPKAAPQGEAS